jgi:hypothetical protein
LKKLECHFCYKLISYTKFDIHEKCCQKKDHSIHYCLCGCKEICNEKYIKGHNRKNKTLSEEHKLKISKNSSGEKNGMFGKKHSEETKKQISKNRSGIESSFKGKHHTDETKEKLRQVNIGKKATQETKDKMSKARIGKKMPPISKETRKKMSVAKLGKSVNKGIKRTDEFKQLMSEYARERTWNNKRWCNIGNNEIELLLKQEIIDNCKIDFNFHIKAFKPDGYCHETNTIYEVYEKYHRPIKIQKKDKIRQFKIQKYLTCNFVIIYDEWNDNKIERF